MSKNTVFLPSAAAGEPSGEPEGEVTCTVYGETSSAEVRSLDSEGMSLTRHCI